MYQWSKDIAFWKIGKTLYLSVVFSWHLKKAEEMARAHKGPVMAGGPAIRHRNIKWADTTYPYAPFYNVLSRHNPSATFTTRGCTKRCPYCIVPKIEGDFKELKDWEPAPLICDNNILASSHKHFESVITKIRRYPFVDFNQGLDATMLKGWHIDQMARLESVKLRFAFDHVNQESSIVGCIERCKKAGFNNFGVYVLIGYMDSPSDALYRLEKVRSLGILPNPMRYQPLDCENKNEYIGPCWTQQEMKKMMRYYSRLRFLGHIPYKDYIHGDETVDMLDMFHAWETNPLRQEYLSRKSPARKQSTERRKPRL